MPITPQLRSMIDRALSNNVLSSREAKRIEAEVEKDGVTPDEVGAVVGALAEALQTDSLELDTANRKKRVNQLLSQLEQHQPLGLDESKIDRSGNRANYLGALAVRALGGNQPPPSTDPTGPTDPAGPTDPTAPADPTTPTDPTGPGGTPTTATDLPQAGFRGQKVAVTGEGGLQLDGQAVTLDHSQPSQAQQDAVMALVRGGQLDALPAETQQKLAQTLLDPLAASMPLDGESENAFLKNTTQVGSLGALAQMGPALNEGQVDQLLDLFGKAPNPMAQSLILRGLEGAELSDTQKTKLAGLEQPDTKDELLKVWDDVRNGDARIGYTDVEGPVAQTALYGLTYCKKQASVDALFEGIETFKDLNKDYSQPWDKEEVGHLDQLMKAYTEKHGALGYVFGTWEGDAPKELAKISNQKVQAEVLPQLEGPSPSLDGVPLSTEQAGFVKELMGGIKDEKAVRQLGSALKEAAYLTSPNTRPWGGAPMPDEAMSPSSFALFQRVAKRFVEAREGTEDGMLDARGLQNAVEKEAKDIREVMQPRMATLQMDPPSYDGVPVSDAVADRLEQLFTDHTSSAMSVENLGLALQVVADKHGGEVKSDEAAAVFGKVVDDYLANWPDLQTFDFNKLERIAKFAVEGKDVPLCTINGKEVGLADFYNQVAGAVTEAFDRTKLRQPWMADRFGFRAKESVERLDIFAEKTARGEGPVAKLREQFPGKEIEIAVTGRDGAHEEFLFRVKDPSGRVEGTFNQGSDGVIKPWRGGSDPELMTAKINDDGSFDVKVPDPISTREYPLQTNYGVGDSIDVGYYDQGAQDRKVEGEEFETRYKIIEGTIKGFTADGDYEVAYKKPDGTDTTEIMSLERLQELNNPHYYSEKGSSIRDMDINVPRDEALAKFLDDAQPIIDRHLPADGSMADMSAGEIAKRQKSAIDELMSYADDNMKYPASKDSATSPEDKRYHELDGQWRNFDLGELFKIKKGMCRHQCVALQLLLQRAGIDGRLASGAANTSSGDYRGLHLWSEIQTADGQRYLSDQTWKDEAIPLWDGAYDSDKRRLEIYNRTDDFDPYLAD